MKMKFLYSIIFSLLTQIINAQENITLELVKKDPRVVNVKKQLSGKKLSPIKNYFDSIIAWIEVKKISRKTLAKKTKLIYKNDTLLEVLTFGETKVCEKANLIVDYNEDWVSNEEAYSLTFYNLKGKIIKQYTKKYKSGKLRMSDNGYTVIAGINPKNKNEGCIVLHDKNGGEVFNKKLENSFTEEIEISKNGNYIVYKAKTSSCNPLDDTFYITLINNKAEIIFHQKFSKPIQSFVFSNTENYVVLEGLFNIALFDIKTSKFLWFNNTKYKGVYKSILFFEELNCLAILDGGSQIWKLYILDLLTGKELSNVNIPELQEVEIYNKVFKKKNDNSLIINCKNYIYTYRINKK